MKIDRIRSFVGFALLFAFAAMALCSVGCGKKPAPFDAEAAFEKLLKDVKYESELTDAGSTAEFLFGDLPEGTKVRMYSAGDTSEDALIMLTAPGEEGVDAVRASVEGYISERLYQAERYTPEQVQKLKDALVFVNGNTVIVCISDDVAAASDILYK